MLWWFDGPTVGGPSFELFGVGLSDPIQRFYIFLLLATLAVLHATNLRRSHTWPAMAGVAGAMFGWEAQFLTIDATVNLLISIGFIAMIVLGGIGTVVGAVLGAVASVVPGHLADSLLGELPLFDRLSSGQRQSSFQAILVAAFLIAELLGMYGVWLRIKLYFMAWPFRY